MAYLSLHNILWLNFGFVGDLQLVSMNSDIVVMQFFECTSKQLSFPKEFEQK